MELPEFKPQQDNPEHFRVLVEHAKHYAIFGIDDLCNPLNAITLSAALMAPRVAGDEQLARHVRRIADAAHRGGRIVSDLLDLSQTQLLGSIPIAPTEIDLSAFARQIVDEHRAANPEREMQLLQQGSAIGHWDGQRIAHERVTHCSSPVAGSTGTREWLRFERLTARADFSAARAPNAVHASPRNRTKVEHLAPHPTAAIGDGHRVALGFPLPYGGLPGAPRSLRAEPLRARSKRT